MITRKTVTVVPRLVALAACTSTAGKREFVPGRVDRGTAGVDNGGRAVDGAEHAGRALPHRDVCCRQRGFWDRGVGGPIPDGSGMAWRWLPGPLREEKSIG